MKTFIVCFKLYQFKDEPTHNETLIEQLKNKLSQMQIVERAWLEEKISMQQ